MPIPRCARLLLAGFFPLCLASAANGAVLTDEPVVPSASEVVIELARHQLTPEVLCIAGFVPAEIDGFIGHATDTLVDEWDEMLAARTRIEEARTQLAAALAALRGPGDHQQMAAAVAAARAELNAALSDGHILDARIRNEFDAGMGSGPRGLVQAVRDNAARGLPLEYLTRSLADESWMELRHAFAHVHTVQEPDEPEPGIQQILDIYDSDSAVTAARSALALYGPQVRNAYLSSLFDE